MAAFTMLLGSGGNLEEIPSGTLEVNSNGTHDVTNYSVLNVNIPAAVLFAPVIEVRKDDYNRIEIWVTDDKNGIWADKYELYVDGQDTGIESQYGIFDCAEVDWLSSGAHVFTVVAKNASGMPMNSPLSNEITLYGGVNGAWQII